MSGNVMEWCQDVWHGNYTGAPNNGSARMEGRYDFHRVLRGGSWLNLEEGRRVKGRDFAYGTFGNCFMHIGFRLAHSYEK